MIDHECPVCGRWNQRAEEEEDKITRELTRLTAENETAKDEGADFVLDALADALGVQVRPADGSETWGGDVRGTLYNLLRDANVLDPEDDTRATAKVARRTAENERLREALRPLGDVLVYRIEDDSSVLILGIGDVRVSVPIDSQTAVFALKLEALLSSTRAALEQP